MALTEIALDMSDERVALCRHTAPPRMAHGVMRILDQGQLSGRFVALITFVGTREAAQDLVRDMQRERPAVDIETMAQNSESCTIRMSVPLEAHDATPARLQAVLRLFERLGPDAVVEPILFRGGRVRARIILPRHVDNATVHAAVTEAQQGAAFRELRLLRVTRIEPDRHLEVLRPLLHPDQDVLLRLAVGMGYYANPKRATLDDISGRVGLSISPIHKRLKSAEELLVAAHVGGAARAAIPPLMTRRRTRRRTGHGAGGAGAHELDVIAQAPQHVVARFARANRGARVLLHPLSEDARSGKASWLVLAAGSRAQCDNLAEHLRSEAGVQCDEVAREDAHACLRVHGPTEGGWGYGAIAAAFGHFAALRRMVFEGESVFARIVVASPMPLDDVEGRLSKALVGMGWTSPELVGAAQSDAARVPPDLPEPLSPRQEEVLKVAHALGYYRTPRGCTLEQVASTLGVSANAIHKNLVGAEARIIANYLMSGF